MPDDATVLTVYTTSWCGYCRRLLHQLDRHGVEHVVIDIERDAGAAAFVERVNGGNRTVPTVVFPDGGTETNPGFRRVAGRLGLQRPPSALVRLLGSPRRRG